MARLLVAGATRPPCRDGRATRHDLFDGNRLRAAAEPALVAGQPMPSCSGTRQSSDSLTADRNSGEFRYERREVPIVDTPSRCA
jgi:hypothetical protein